MKGSRIKYLFILLVMVITMVMYVPVVYNSGLYGILKYVVFGLMAVLVLMTFRWSTLMHYSFTRSVGIILLFIFIEFLFFIAFQLNKVSGDFIQLVIVLLMLMAGVNSSMNESAFVKLCTMYIVGSVLLGSLAIVSYLGSFSIASNAYAIEGKNQVGAIVAFGSGIAFYLSQVKKSRFFLILSLIGVVLSLVIRCRTATVGLLLFILYILAFNWSIRKRVLFAILAVCLYMAFFSSINKYVSDIFLGNADIEVDQGDYFNRISASRFERNESAVLFLRDHPITGELKELSGIPQIHNYALLRLTRYGLFALPLLIFYFIFVVKCIRSLIQGIQGLNNMGWILLMIPLFCSLLEPSAPFGPGTVQLMPYILCGIALRGGPVD